MAAKVGLHWFVIVSSKGPCIGPTAAFKMSLIGKPLCALHEVDADKALFPEKPVVSTPASFNTALAHLLTVDSASGL